MLSNILQGKIPNLDSHSAQQLALLETEFKDASKTFRHLASYAEARQNKLIMQERGLVVSAFRFQQAERWVWDKLPTWARW